MKVLGDQVIVKKEEREITQVGSLYISAPEEDYSYAARGVVVSVGKPLESEVNQGDVVYFSLRHAQPIPGHAEHFVIKNADLLAVEEA